MFTLRTGIDFLFQPFRPEDSEEVSVFLVGTDAGDVHLSIYDSLTIGTFKYQSTTLGSLRLARHASHPAVSTHTLLFRPADARTLEIVPMDLAFVAASPINLSLLASKLTTLQTLMRYVRQCLLHMQVEYRNTRELPARFLASVQEDLERAENGPRDVVSALYHTLVTGHTYEAVREWLVDTLAERVSRPPPSLADSQPFSSQTHCPRSMEGGRLHQRNQNRANKGERATSAGIKPSQHR